MLFLKVRRYIKAKMWDSQKCRADTGYRREGGGGGGSRVTFCLVPHELKAKRGTTGDHSENLRVSHHPNLSFLSLFDSSVGCVVLSVSVIIFGKQTNRPRTAELVRVSILQN